MNQFLLKLISRKSLSLIAINKNQSEVKHCSKDNLFRCRHVTLGMISTFILCRLRWFANKLPTSLCGIPICCDLFRKRIDLKKFPFTATPNWNPLAGQWSVKYFFCSGFPNIPDPSQHSSWWRRLEDVLKKSFIVLFRRHLHQDEYISLSRTSSEDVLKTSSRRLDQDQYICLGHMFKTSSKHLQDVLQRCLQDVFKTYHKVKLFLLKRLQDSYEMYSTRFWGVLQRLFVIYRMICLDYTSEKFMVNCKSVKIFRSFSFTLYYTF